MRRTARRRAARRSGAVSFREMAAQAVIEQDEEAARVFHWRVRRCRSLGFTLWQARRLAEEQASWHEAEALLMAGCPLHVVFDLLT
jgi:hypothetical protein